MPIEVACPTCDAKLKAPDALAGKIVKCPRCSEKVLVDRPAPSTVVATVPKPHPMNLSIEERDEPEDNDYQEEPENNQELDELDELPEVDDEQAEAGGDDEVDEVLAADDDEDEVDDRYAERDDDRPRKPKKKKKKRRGGAPDKDECTMGMLIHLLSIFTGFIGPLILWLMKRNESKFIDHHGKVSLNFNITLFLAAVCLGVLGAPLALATFGLAIPIIGLLNVGLMVYGLVMKIIATMRANNGEWYEYPLCFEFFK